MAHIGIVGAGHLGSVLAKRLVAAGHTVKVANSRGQHTLAGFALETGATPTDIAKVSEAVDILIVAIPLGQVRSLSKALIESLPKAAVVVDTSNYVPPRDGPIAQIDAGQPESSWVSDQLGVPVVKAFNNITDYSLEHNGRPMGARDRIALPIGGNDLPARARIMRLVESLGFSPFDAGTLEQSWRQQIGQPAYCTDPTFRQLPELLARARSETVVPNRENAMKLMAKMPDNFPKKQLARAARFMVGMDRFKPASWWAILSLAVALVRPRH